MTPVGRSGRGDSNKHTFSNKHLSKKNRRLRRLIKNQFFVCILIQHFSVRPRLANINKIGCVLKHARRRRKILAFLDFKTSISIAKTQFQYDFAPQNAKKPALCAEFCARCLFGMFISPSPDAVGRSGRVTRTQDSIAAALSPFLRFWMRFYAFYINFEMY